MVTLGIVANVDATGVYVTMPGSRGLLRGPYLTLQNVAAGDRVLIVTTDDGEDVIVGLASAAAPRSTPATTVDNTVPRFDGTGGELQTSGVTISDLNVLGGLADGAAATDAVTKSQLDGKLTTPAAWTSYEPTLTASSSNPTGWTQTGYYCQVGKLVVAKFIITAGGAMTKGSGYYRVALPVAPNANYQAETATVALYDSDAAHQVHAVGVISGSGSYIEMQYQATHLGAITVTSDAAPWTWAASDTIRGTITYEAA